MARPKVPLISKREVLSVALRIIDDEGLDALSVRRLAAEFKVNAAAFYHHFESKDEIIAGAAELALEDVQVPRGSTGDWRQLMLRSAKAFRKGLVAHPDLIMVMIGRGRGRIGLRRIGATVRALELEGLPPEGTIAILSALETFAIGSAISEGHQNESPSIPADLQREYADVAQALVRRPFGHEAEFEIGCRAIIDAVAAEYGVEAQPWPAHRHRPTHTQPRSVLSGRI